MRKLLLFTALFSLLLLFVQCDRETGDINSPKTMVKTEWSGYFDEKELKRLTGGYFDAYEVYSMSIHIVFVDEENFYSEGSVRHSGGKGYFKMEGTYTYNASTGRIKMKYNQSFMGMNTDRGRIKGEYLILTNGLDEAKFRKVY